MQATAPALEIDFESKTITNSPYTGTRRFPPSTQVVEILTIPTPSPPPPTLEERQESAKRFFRENEYKSCCGLILDRRLLNFLVKVVFAFFGMLFAMERMTNSEDPKDMTIYSNVLIMILGSMLFPDHNVHVRTPGVESE